MTHDTEKPQTETAAVARLRDEWTAQLFKIHRSFDGSQWDLARHLAEGEKKFGTDALKDAADITHFSPQSIRTAIETANAFPEPNPNLTFVTHSRALNLPPEGQKEFFELAGAEGWDDIEATSELARKAAETARKKPTKELFQLETVFSFNRQFTKLEQNFDKLPEGQKPEIKDELVALARRIIEWAEVDG